MNKKYIYSLPETRLSSIVPEKNIVLLSIDGKKPFSNKKGFINKLKSITTHENSYIFESGKREIIFKYSDSSILKKDRVNTGNISISYFFKSKKSYRLSANKKNDKITFNIQET